LFLDLINELITVEEGLSEWLGENSSDVHDTLFVLLKVSCCNIGGVVLVHKEEVIHQK
jgi:hypothetical protein